DRGIAGEVAVQEPQRLARRLLSERHFPEQYRRDTDEEQTDRPEPEQRFLSCPQAADAEPEERAEQDQVREVREDAHFARHPADERELLEEDGEGSEEETQRHGEQPFAVTIARPRGPALYGQR